MTANMLTVVPIQANDTPCACPTCGSAVTFPDFVLNENGAHWKGHRVKLTRNEFVIFQLLFKRLGMVNSRGSILDSICFDKPECDEPEIKIIDVYICKIRRKVREHMGNLFEVENIWGRGYMMKKAPQQRRFK